MAKEEQWRLVVRGISKAKKAHVLGPHIKWGIYETVCGRHQIQIENTEVVMQEDYHFYNIQRCKKCEKRLKVDMTKQIKFSGGIFSNFAPYTITLDGKSWKSTEHYYQAQKSLDPEYAERIRMAVDARQAAALGRSADCPIRQDWKAVRLEVMERAVRAKFTQHNICRATLLNTGNAELVERTDTDDFWGDGKDGTGSNYLGKCLMATRDWLRRMEDIDL